MLAIQANVLYLQLYTYVNVVNVVNVNTLWIGLRKEKQRKNLRKTKTLVVFRGNQTRLLNKLAAIDRSLCI